MNGMIDVHHHVPAAAIAEAAASVGLTVGRGWTPERALADMDASGIAAAVLTPIVFVADVADPAAAVPLHRAANDYLVLRDESGFDAAQLAAIGAANARPLFPRLAAALDAAG